MTACLQKALNKYTLLTYKLANPTVNGFESIVLCITPNKDFSCINYVHYNVQKWANLTRNAIAGLSEKLMSTSVMTVQIRIALVMLLAKNWTHWVRPMLGLACCMYISNYTALDGSVTRAPEGLWKLSHEMKEFSGIDVVRSHV